MKAVLAHVLRRKRACADLPLFERLRDDTLPASARLGFVPDFAFFIMAFGDLNRYLLRRAPADDIHHERVSTHAAARAPQFVEAQPVAS